MKVIGFDFSIEKPGACVFDGHTYEFKSWAWGLRDDLRTIYNMNGVEVYPRTDKKLPSVDFSQKMNNDVARAIHLADRILYDFKNMELDSDTYIVWEGLSFGSTGNQTLQLGGYKYLVMDRLKEIVDMDNHVTYAPSTIKKTAGCSAKGTPKSAMIDAFVGSGLDIQLRNAIEWDRSVFRKRGDMNWIDHLDDLVDAFWCVETFREKVLIPMSESPLK